MFCWYKKFSQIAEKGNVTYLEWIVDNKHNVWCISKNCTDIELRNATMEDYPGFQHHVNYK